MKSSLFLIILSPALAAALPAPAISYPSSLLFPTTFSTSMLPASSAGPSAGGGTGIMVDNMPPDGGGMPPGGMGGEIGKRGKLDTDKDSAVDDVYTSGKNGDDKSQDGDKDRDSWMDKGFAGDTFKGDKDKNDDKSKDKDDDKSEDKDNKSSGHSTFDNKNDKSSMDKSIPDVSAGTDKSADKPAAGDKPTTEINNSNTFFDPAAEKTRKNWL